MTPDPWGIEEGQISWPTCLELDTCGQCVLLQSIEVFSNPNIIMGNQKQAREERLKREIRRYIRSNPDCTASQIVAHLSIDLRMRNHGLTPRKVGFFIPRYVNDVDWRLDSSTGKRLYSMAE